MSYFYLPLRSYNTVMTANDSKPLSELFPCGIWFEMRGEELVSVCAPGQCEILEMPGSSGCTLHRHQPCPTLDRPLTVNYEGLGETEL